MPCGGARGGPAMSSEMGLAVTRIALFLIVAAGLMLLIVPAGSAEFVVLALTIGVGMAMLALVGVLVRLGGARWATPREKADDSLQGPKEDPR